VKTKKPPLWRGFHTSGLLCRNARKLDRKNNSVESVLNQMRAGARLLLHYRNGTPVWQLTLGGEVAPETAADVIKHRDCLFEGVASQTYRYVD
jgi:hypothetical protein